MLGAVTPILALRVAFLELMVQRMMYIRVHMYVLDNKLWFGFLFVSSTQTVESLPAMGANCFEGQRLT